MRVAIYARYSSKNQSGKSIDDQVRGCQKYIEANGLIFNEKQIYTDEAISGSIHNRPGLQALEKAIENKEVDAIAVDDLSRLSKSNHQMLALVNKFNFYQIKIISVSDGIITDDDHSKPGIHIRRWINELYLDDLKKKTKGRLEGIKIRDLRLNKKGQPKVYDEEAPIVRRIYRVINGSSIISLAQALNKEKVSTRRSGDWNTSTLSRILKNGKYTGLWVWRKYKGIRDPMNGKRKQTAEKEQISSFKEVLSIIDKETWERWEEVDDAWPMIKTSRPQKSYIYANPTHVLAGLIKCKCCDGAMEKVSGKEGRFYGCSNAKRKSCTNKLLVPRKKIEAIILNDLREKFLTVENLKYVYQNVEKVIAKTLNEAPEDLRQKQNQYENIQAELQNLLNFIKAGNFSKAVSEELTDAETEEKS